MSSARQERFISRGFSRSRRISPKDAVTIARRALPWRSAQPDSSAKGDLNRKDLAEAVVKRIGIPQQQADLVVRSLFDTITGALRDGRNVRVLGFGTFSIIKRSGSIGRNPRTGEPMTIEPHAQPRFKPGKTLKEAMNS